MTQSVEQFLSETAEAEEAEVGFREEMARILEARIDGRIWAHLGVRFTPSPDPAGLSLGGWISI